ncbi:MAG: tRNA (guanosine(37)-N1)-methyltransferase TrmD [Eggerthellaceae bacterium]|nr:tRNA (guanosine(37)-N1)-methyltransferase TrmD [Eggerthellaceae bacterium]
MRIDTLSTFPDMYDSVMGTSMMRLARERGVIEFHAYDLRDWTHDRHRSTDDYPYGGGSGLVMKCDPVYEAMESILGLSSGSLPESKADVPSARVIFLSPHGRTFDDRYALELSKCDRLVFVCGHYEGMDERVYALADDMISLGDYVLTSGELASMVVIDAVVRKLDGVLGAEDGAADESFATGLLEYPQYTRPANFRGMEVPEVLLSGHHAKIEKWRRQTSLRRTLELRPDLIEEYIESDRISESDLIFLKKSLDGKA